MRRVVWGMLGFVVLLATACGEKGAKETPLPMVVASTPRDSLDRPVGDFQRPPTLQVELEVDGSSRLVQAELVTQPAGFPLVFTTYKPADMMMASSQISGRSIISVTPMLDGKTVPDAFIQVLADSASLTASDPAGTELAAFQQAVQATRISETDLPRYRSSAAAKTFRQTIGGKEFAGSIIVGVRDGLHYQILVQYPIEYAAAMETRSKVFLEQWRWEDNRNYLVLSGEAVRAKADTVPVKPDTAQAGK